MDPERSWTRCRSIGESEGSRAVGGCGDIEAAGKEASKGLRSSSHCGGDRAVIFVEVVKGVFDHMQISAMQD